MPIRRTVKIAPSLAAMSIVSPSATPTTWYVTGGGDGVVGGSVVGAVADGAVVGASLVLVGATVVGGVAVSGVVTSGARSSAFVVPAAQAVRHSPAARMVVTPRPAGRHR
jgi:hypothetical protein